MMTIPPCLPDKAVGPDAVYSRIFAPTLQVDGACFSNPEALTAISDEDSTLIVDTGTSHVNCAVIACGPVGLYCYEAVDLPVSGRLAFMPLEFPIPLIAFAENRARCYHEPKLVKQVFEDYGTVAGSTGLLYYGSYAVAATSPTCGVTHEYFACNGTSSVIAANSSAPAIYYSGECWSNPVVILDTGTRPILSGTDFTAATGCYDAICNGTDDNGPSVPYADRELGKAVNVQFEHLDRGIPHYGVAAEQLDTGANGIVDGAMTFTFQGHTTSVVILPYAPGTGRMEFNVNLPGRKKCIIVTRAGVDTSYLLSTNASLALLYIVAGDRISLALDALRATASYIHKPVSGSVTWKSAPLSLRMYASHLLPSVGTTTVEAVGFCGMLARTSYEFYGTLPATAVQEYPNPDTYLTVQGVGSQEYVLVSCYAAGDVVPHGPGGTVPYAGQSLVSPLTFRFYTGRGAAGSHGEMDVWLSTPGSFPSYLAAGHYTLLELSPAWYRRTAQVGDTKRSSLNVASGHTAHRLPSIYVSAQGVKVVVEETVPQPTYVDSGTTYYLAGTAYGLAYSVR